MPRFLCELVHCRIGRFMPTLPFRSAGYGSDIRRSGEMRRRPHALRVLCVMSQALSQMQTNKSPGADGFPVEFYRRFRSSLGQDLVEVLNYSYEHGQLSDSQKQGIIRLLYKKEDPLLLKNWRPISLLRPSP